MVALRQLPEENRLALTLCYAGERSINEVGDILGIDANALKMRLYRARKKLKKEVLTMVEETLEETSPGSKFTDRFKHVQLTVLCTELAGLGPFTHRMSAIEEAEFLYEYNTEMTDIILEHGGTLDRYDKGHIVAFFGDPEREPEHAERACTAALAMRARLHSRWGTRFRAEAAMWPEYWRSSRGQYGVQVPSRIHRGRRRR